VAVRAVARRAEESAEGDAGGAFPPGHDDLKPGIGVYGYLGGSQGIAFLIAGSRRQSDL
jgi:hypothetical protein